MSRRLTAGIAALLGTGGASYTPPPSQCLGKYRRYRPVLEGSVTGSGDEKPYLDRRATFGRSATAIVPFLSAKAASSQPKGGAITVPLRLSANGAAYLVYYRIGGSLFRAALDSGSPFLVVAGSCTETSKAKWGCYRPELSMPTELENTIEIYDGREGEVEWRLGTFAFVNATASSPDLLAPAARVFGVASESLTKPPGGVFFGLVRDADTRIRPSFLGQTAVKSFSIDLGHAKELTLSTNELLGGRDDFIPLIDDLRKKYRDPTGHYTARAKGIIVNGVTLGADGRPIYVIFDTGVTGMVVSQSLFEERYSTARGRHEGNLWGRVAVQFTTQQGRILEATAVSPITTPVAELPWKNFRGHLVVLGLSFFEDTKLTIDIDSKRAWMEDSSGRSSYSAIPKVRLLR